MPRLLSPFGVVIAGDGYGLSIKVALGQHLLRLTAKRLMVFWKDFASCWSGLILRHRQSGDALIGDSNSGAGSRRRPLLPLGFGQVVVMAAVALHL